MCHVTVQRLTKVIPILDENKDFFFSKNVHLFSTAETRPGINTQGEQTELPAHTGTTRTQQANPAEQKYEAYNFSDPGKLSHTHTDLRSAPLLTHFKEHPQLDSHSV